MNRINKSTDGVFSNYSSAFTLAEILITLAIIGIVAALSISSVITNVNKEISKTSFKKVYSEMTRVNSMINFDYGGNWASSCADFDDKCFRDLFAEKMRVAKICDKPLDDGCVVKSKFKNNRSVAENINVNDNWPGLVVQSGYSIKFRFHSEKCSESNPVCGWVQIDTNGVKKPNIVGSDIFFFEILSDRTVKPMLLYKGIDYLTNDCNKGSGIACGALYLIQQHRQ